MNHTPNNPKRFKPNPTFTIPALLAVAGLTVVGLILVERGRSQVTTQTEALFPPDTPPIAPPGSLETQPQPIAPTASSPATHRGKATPAYSASPASALMEVKPEYPRIAKITRTQGPVEVELRVDAAGRPVQAMILSGNTLLRNEALKAAQGWKFAPAHVNGRAVPSDFRIRFEFRLA